MENSQEDDDEISANLLLYMRQKPIDDEEAYHLRINIEEANKKAAKLLEASSNQLEDDDIYTPPDFPPVFRTLRDEIGGSVSKPFQKQLTESDLKDNQNRLLLKKQDVENIVLPLLNEEDDVRTGMQAIVYDPNGKPWNMVFKMWSSNVYVLTSSWKPFYHKHGFAPNDFVKIWAFRQSHSRKLCFVFNF